MLLLAVLLAPMTVAVPAMAVDPATAGPLLPVYADAAQVDAACAKGLTDARGAIARFANLPAAASSGEVLRQWDAVSVLLEDFSGPVELASAVSTDEKVRNAADACNVKVAELQSELYQNPQVYAQLRRVQPADGADAELLKISNEGFEDAGVTLPADKRKRAKQVLDRIEALAVEFQRNTRENRGSITFTASEMEGLPASFMAKHPADAQGRHVLAMDYPDYFPFMDNAISGDARRRYFVAFNSIGGERNIAILNEASTLRKELATLFGKASYAEYAIARRMAGTPEKVLAFLAQVKDKVTEAEKQDLDVLRQAKARLLGRDPAEVKLERWDVAFYSERVRRERYAVDQDALRRYFPTEAAIAWVFELAEKMYGVHFAPRKVASWHEDVRYFDVMDADGKFIAGAYLDPYPRPGKYNHAAVWPVRHGSTLTGRTPISVLVTNLDRKGLDHNELETLLHEFGHLLHGDLSRTKYASLGGTSVRRDFVEAPSQMFEEWARNSESLGLLKKHCGDCPAVDDALLNRINQARKFARGIRYARQHNLASFDMALAGSQPGEALATWRGIEEASALGHVTGTRFPAQFGHLLGGYAAGYYGYMWSEVLALDMVSRWNGKLMEPATGRRYREMVLSRGGEAPPDQLVRDFLGREPSPEPFFAEIVGKR